MNCLNFQKMVCRCSNYKILYKLIITIIIILFYLFWTVVKKLLCVVKMWEGEEGGREIQFLIYIVYREFKSHVTRFTSFFFYRIHVIGSLASYCLQSHFISLIPSFYCFTGKGLWFIHKKAINSIWLLQ